ncbi:hypothetical protein MIND_00265400 [Mycena indigotica]|uniref:Uncharacterized protein n=1 Tax=Mycena indigotica TaxID=2126181 RepID=A0A8H6T8X5_9AGAR|nr:uncharacterized protein MIND_00265400 [Mycena indigotica]KAF7312517.1 hypothetical protein MIND_00265400 [Mycena indigotica]
MCECAGFRPRQSPNPNSADAYKSRIRPILVLYCEPPLSQLEAMSGKSTSSSSKGGDYTVTSSGTNSNGNHYCHREYSSGGGYHYSNSDGSYYYNNPNGSTYYDNGKGGSTYTTPGGYKVQK